MGSNCHESSVEHIVIVGFHTGFFIGGCRSLLDVQCVWVCIQHTCVSVLKLGGLGAGPPNGNFLKMFSDCF